MREEKATLWLAAVVACDRLGLPRYSPLANVCKRRENKSGENLYKY